MEDFNVYDNTTNKDLREQAIKASEIYYELFEEIETVRVSPTRQIVIKKLKNNKKPRRNDEVIY